MRPFLTAEWRNIAMLNFAVDPACLEGLVPRGTEPDPFEGKTYLSLVGFRFLHTRLRGLWIPFHADFDEVNLRFYVRRSGRRGVAFVREIVPRYAVARVARAVFGEKYISLKMAHRIIEPVSEFGRMEAEYRWRYGGQWNRLRMECSGRPEVPAEGSFEQFIAEHYWGYAAQAGGGTMEYRVEHDPWRVWKASGAKFEGDATALYGAEFGACLSGPADSAFLAQGSAVAVYPGGRIG